MQLDLHARRTRAMLCALAFALWLASTLGLVHRTLHNGVTVHAALVSVVSEASRGQAVAQAVAHDGSAASAHAHRGLAALFGDHTDAECRLYDQLSHGSAPLCVPLLILPVMLPAATFAWLEGEALARWVALFDARGPPSTR